MNQNNQNNKDNEQTLRGTIDVCNVQKATFGNFIIKLIVENFETYSNYKFQCPVKKGSLYVYNLGIDLKNIPSHIIEFYRLWEITLVVKGKTANMKLLDKMITTKIRGIIIP